jgi:4'-phosphopantetheinyl transferase
VRPAPGEITVWRIRLDNGGESECLNEAERAFAESAIDPQVRRRRIQARAALRHILGVCLDIPAAAVALSLQAHGKPRVEHGPPFNLTHCGELMLLAVSGAGEVGVDMEASGRMDEDWPAVAVRAFSLAEQHALAALPPAEQSEAALRAWVRKEAYAKARGAGFAYGFQSFTVRMIAHQEESLLMDDARDQEATSRWRLLDLAAPPDGFVASLAHAGHGAAIHYRDYGELRS